MALGLTVAAGLGGQTATAQAQTLDFEDGVHVAPARTGGQSQDASTLRTAPPTPVPQQTPRDTIQDGARIQVLPPDQLKETGEGQPGGTPLVTAMPASDLPEPVNLDHPTIVDTAKLAANGKTVPLFGIIGQSGQLAQQLDKYMAATDGHLTCPAQTSTDYVCMLSDGTDIAMVALRNGAARTRDDAPEAYRQQEVLAQVDRFGIWANLPPPPAVLNHPTLKDTATLVSGPRTYILDGLVGTGQPYVEQMRGYIAAHGDTLSCEPQGLPDHYICVLNDGTDIAKVALVNGAASVAADAPDSYRVQQLEALNNKRGLWLNPSQAFVVANANTALSDACCVFVAGDEGGDGISYVGGEPTVIIDGAPVFLVLAAGLGWGYYDLHHHWRDAPSRYRSHMERFHPNGQGLRAYRGPGVAGHAGNVGHASLGSAGRPVASGGAGVNHTAAGSVGNHAGFVPGGAAVQNHHASVGAGHPAVGGGGFVRPAVTSAPAFHPAGAVQHAAAPVAHASAPAPHVSAPQPQKHH